MDFWHVTERQEWVGCGRENPLVFQNKTPLRIGLEIKHKKRLIGFLFRYRSVVLGTTDLWYLNRSAGARETQRTSCYVSMTTALNSQRCACLLFTLVFRANSNYFKRGKYWSPTVTRVGPKFPQSGDTSMLFTSCHLLLFQVSWSPSLLSGAQLPCSSSQFV